MLCHFNLHKGLVNIYITFFIISINFRRYHIKNLNLESKDIKESKLLGKEVEEIIVGPIKLHHKDYVLKLIKYGEPTFLASEFLKLIIKDATGYIREINSLIRLKDNMDEL